MSVTFKEHKLAFIVKIWQRRICSRSFHETKGRSPLQKFFRGEEDFQLCASAPTNNTINYSPCTGNVFSVFELKKIQIQDRKIYSIVLSANEIAKCNRLKHKTNTVKKCCEKSKCRVVINWHCKYSVAVLRIIFKISWSGWSEKSKSPRSYQIIGGQIKIFW